MQSLATRNYDPRVFKEPAQRTEAPRTRTRERRHNFNDLKGYRKATPRFLNLELLCGRIATVRVRKARCLAYDPRTLGSALRVALDSHIPAAVAPQ